MNAKVPEHSIHVGLALSGGGVRAAAFHAGVLRCLAEHDQLESVVHISSVSGGSLFVGLVFSASHYQWPSSSEYQSTVFPHIRNVLTTRCLQHSALFRLLFQPLNWRFLMARANVLARTIQSLWGIDMPLGRITSKPIWSINATTAETGRRFRFKAGQMGDYELGYADASTLSLAAAMAVSAAFPGGIGPLSLRTQDYQWRKRSSWSVTDDPKPHVPMFARLHLYDGGLYDNLGIEPLFDVGSQSLKTTDEEHVNYLLVSDAGAALSRAAIPSSLNPWRFKRIADIALDQTRALRVRAFVNFLKNNPAHGAYLQLGANPVQRINLFAKGREHLATALLEHEWLQADDVEAAATYPTTLRQLTGSEFDLIARHGFETACWNVELLGETFR